MVGPLDGAAGPKTYIQRSKRYFLDKHIYDHRVAEELICVEAAEWTIDANAFQNHMERLRQLQRNGREYVRISESADGIVTVERRLDHDYCRVITTYTPEGVEAPVEPGSEPKHGYLRLIHALRRIEERRKYFG